MALATANALKEIEEEIALEGLDGITLQGLWVRLENRVNFCKKPHLDYNTKLCIWSMICDDNELSFYRLPTPRADLIISNRYENMDPELGIVVESPTNHPQELYPFHKVEDEGTGEMGSCQHYHTREDVSEEVSQLELDEVEERYKRGELVVVASQMLRDKVLWVNTNVDPFNPLTLAQYCILERIARTRTMGDITQGKHGMTQLGDAKSLFYHRKRLLKLRLITKQTHLQKNLKGVSQTGSLLHHAQFYVERKSKFVLLIEHCIELLRGMPNYTVPLSLLKESLALPDLSFKKLIKNIEFSKYIKTELLPHSKVYPNATPREMYDKNKKERQVRCFVLADPKLSPGDLHADEPPEPDDDDEDDAAGILDRSKIVLFKSALQRAYEVARENGPEGTTQREIMEKLGQTRLDSRTICRNLLRSGAVDSIMRDAGRQRVTHFVPRDQVHSSRLTQEFSHEKQKLLKLMHNASSGDATDNDEPSIYTEVEPVITEPKPSSSAANCTKSSCHKSDNLVGKITPSEAECDSNVVGKIFKEQETPEESLVILPTRPQNDPTTIQLDGSALVISLDDRVIETDDQAPDNSSDNRAISLETNDADDNHSSDAPAITVSTSPSDLELSNSNLISNSNLVHTELEISQGLADQSCTTEVSNPDKVRKSNEVNEAEHVTDENLNASQELSSLALKCEDGGPSKSVVIKRELDNSQVGVSNVGRIFDKRKGEYVSDTNLQEAMLSALDVPTTSQVTDADDAAQDEDLPTVVSIIEDSTLAFTDDPDARYRKFLDGSECFESNSKRLSSQLTTRLLKRSNIILETVRTHRVIPDSFQLQKAILESEVDLNHRIDKKSVTRLVQRLRAGGFIRIVKVKFKTSSGYKEHSIIVHPSVPSNDAQIESVIEQLRMKHLPPPSKKDATKKKGNVLVVTSTSPNLSMKYFKVKKNNSRALGKSSLARPAPKFRRLQELHHLFFYLARNYEGDVNLDQQATWSAIRQDNPGLDIASESLPRLYTPDACWKMFIPPLGEHARATCGWVLLSDVIMSLPLYVFTRVVRCAIDNELAKWVRHPIKRFYLIKMLPASLRSEVLESRRYVYHILELVHRLCYMGLLQMGPQISAPYREQQLVYVNCRTTLTDTSTSGPGYHQISQDRSYALLTHSFHDLKSVSQYWQDLQRICLSTPLGGNRGVAGQDITVLMLRHKPAMEEAISVRQIAEAPERDTGNVPGDHKGAAGLDSAMFAHLKRNWNFARSALADAPVEAILPDSGIDRSLYSCTSAPTYACATSARPTLPCGALYRSYLLSTTQQTPATSSGSRLPGLRKMATPYKNRKGEKKAVEFDVRIMSRAEKKSMKPKQKPEVKKRPLLGLRRISRRKVMLRKLKARAKPSKKPYYDEEDRAALRRMNKLRVDWSSAEDSLLLLCKVASCYLLPAALRPRMLPFSLVRTVLHKHCPESLNKTARACQRRMNYILKDQTTEDSVAIYVEEVKDDIYIRMNFVPPCIARSRENLESIYGSLFIELVDYLLKKFNSSTKRKVLNLHDSYKEFERHFEVVSMKGIKPAPHYSEPANVPDIQSHAITSLLMSSLCSRADRESYAYQLYQAYGHYSHQTLYNTLVKLRNSQMISYKKSYNRSVNISQTCLPLSASPFQLSLAFTQKFMNRYNYDLYDQCWAFMKRLKQSYYHALKSGERPEDLVRNAEYSVPLTREKKNEGGSVAALIELTSIKRVIMHTYLPETIIVIDTKRTITDQLPFQTGSTCRRNCDLTKVCEDVSNSCQESEMEENQEDTEAFNTVHGIKRARSEDESEDVDGRISKEKNFDLEKSGKRERFDEDVEVHHSEDEHLAVGTANEEEGFCGTETLNNLDSMLDSNDESFDNQSSSLKFSTVPHGTLKRSLSNDSLSPQRCKRPRLDDDTETEMRDEASNSATDPYAQPDYLADLASHSEDFENCNDVKPSCVKWPVTSASRLSVFMKDQNTISSLENQNIVSGGPGLLQHMQDNLLLTACDVTCQLTTPQGAGLGEPSTALPERLDVDVLPVDRDLHKSVLSKRARGLLNERVSLEETLADWTEAGYSDATLSLVRAIHKFINDKGAFGATRQQIKDWRLSCGGGDCMAVVVAMEEAGLLIREGITQATWLTLPNASHWLVHTQQISRTERQGVRLQGVYTVEFEPSLLNEAGPGVSTARSETQVDHIASNKITGSSSLHCNSIDVVTSEATTAQDSTFEETLYSKDTSAAPVNVEDLLTSGTISPTGTQVPVPEIDDGPETRSVNPLECDVECKLPPNVTTQDIVQADSTFVCTLNDPSSSASLASPSKDHGTRARVRSRFVAAKKNYSKDEEKSQQMEDNVKDYQKSERRQQVQVSVRPWVRVCGTVARRVLDRLLGAVLFTVLERPGVNGTAVALALSPTMPPAHVHELLLMLVDIGCVKRTCVSRIQSYSLFSRTVPQEFTERAGEDVEESEVSYVPTVDCISKLASFIGDKKYTMDFISSDRK